MFPDKRVLVFGESSALLFKLFHLLLAYNAYGVMLPSGQHTCNNLLRTKRSRRVEVLRMGGDLAKLEYGYQGCCYKVDKCDRCLATF